MLPPPWLTLALASTAGARWEGTCGGSYASGGGTRGAVCSGAGGRARQRAWSEAGAGRGRWHHSWYERSHAGSRTRTSP